MLWAFLILDVSKFALFEYFPDKSKSNQIISRVEELDTLEGNHQEDNLTYHLSKFDDRFYYCIVYSDEDFPNNLHETLPKLSSNIMKGDKVTLRQVLQSKSIQQFTTVF